MSTTTPLDAIVRAKLARAITDRSVPDDVVKAVTEQLEALPNAGDIRRLDVSTHGIWIDYFVGPKQWHDLLRDVFGTHLKIKKFEGFPWGVLADDLMQVRFELDVDEVAGLGH